MKYTYYPGCTLKTKAQDLDAYARASAKALGFELEEVENWQCCGGVYPLGTDEIASKLSSVRALNEAKEKVHVRCKHNEVLRVLHHSSNLNCRSDKKYIDIVLLCRLIGSQCILQNLISIYVIFCSYFKIWNPNFSFHFRHSSFLPALIIL